MYNVALAALCSEMLHHNAVCVAQCSTMLHNALAAGVARWVQGPCQPIQVTRCVPRAWAPRPDLAERG
jgi:hypothetical protein